MTNTVKQLSKSVREYKRDAILTPVFVIGEVAMDVVIPMLISNLIDYGITPGNMDYIYTVGFQLVVACLVALALGVLSGRHAAKASAGFAKNLRKDMYYNVQNFAFSNIDKFSTPSIITRMTTDVTNVQMAFQMVIRVAVRSPIMLISALFMAFRLGGKMAMVYLIVIPLLGFGLYFISTSVAKIFKRAFKRYDALNAVVQENVSGIRVVKSYVREDYEIKKFTDMSEGMRQDFTKAETRLALNMPMMQLCIYSTMAAIFWFGSRFILSGGMTTGNLHPHWSFSGYGAYGTRDKKWFYSGQAAYSFNKREYVLWEFPKHYLAFQYTYDVMSPMDKYLATDKDNMFVGWKWTTVDQMSYMRDATLTYELETNTGFSVKAMARHRNDQPAGMLQYWKNNGTTPGEWDEKNTLVHDITTTELGLTLRYAPGETFVNTKQRRVPVSLDAPTFTLSHTVGLKGVLGGEYNFNLTEASIRKRFWFGSWGKLDVTARAGAQWNTVPFPLLNLPMANLSYITQNNESFNLIDNMEFLNDRYASLALSYDMNGKLFNRIPLIKKLKWREMFRIRGMWGTLTDKNNPYKSSNSDLFLFPMRDGMPTSHVMGHTPYVEASVGIYNIFKLLHIEYVRRLTYTDIPGVKKGGVRFMILMIF